MQSVKNILISFIEAMLPRRSGKLALNFRLWESLDSYTPEWQ